jgi:glutamine synthetase
VAGVGDPLGALGETLLAQFIALKREEHGAHARHVSDWELTRYAAMF